MYTNTTSGCDNVTPRNRILTHEVDGELSPIHQPGKADAGTCQVRFGRNSGNMSDPGSVSTPVPGVGNILGLAAVTVYV